MIGNLTKAVRRIINRKQSYRRVFMDASGLVGPDAEIVLADLRRFCRATSSTVMVSPVSKSIDPIAMAMAEGRREVWMRIMGYLHIDEKQIFNLEEPTDGN